VLLGLREIEGISDADHVRHVLMFIPIVIILEAVLLPRNVDLLGPRNFRAVIEAASFIFYSVLPTTALGLRVHLKVVTKVSQLLHFKS
jgi:hypothetical protein